MGRLVAKLSDGGNERHKSAFDHTVEHATRAAEQRGKIAHGVSRGFRRMAKESQAELSALSPLTGLGSLQPVPHG
jgi:hypothetical protein